jgi:hypothetical protein
MGDVLSGKIPGTHDAEVHIERPDGSRIIVIVNIAHDPQAELLVAFSPSYVGINCHAPEQHGARCDLDETINSESHQ